MSGLRDTRLCDCSRMSSTLLTPNCDREAQSHRRGQGAPSGDYGRTYLFYKQLFLGWMLRNVGEVSRLNYSSNHAPYATPKPLFAKRGQLLVPFYSKGRLFVKQ